MKTYEIQRYQGKINGWVPMSPSFIGMRKSYAMGAFSVFKAHYGGGMSYRLVDDESEIIDQWDSPDVSTS